MHTPTLLGSDCDGCIPNSDRSRVFTMKFCHPMHPTTLKESGTKYGKSRKRFFVLEPGQSLLRYYADNAKGKLKGDKGSIVLTRGYGALFSDRLQYYGFRACTSTNVRDVISVATEFMVTDFCNMDSALVVGVDAACVWSLSMPLGCPLSDRCHHKSCRNTAGLWWSNSVKPC
jgi:hypothetical protein